MSAAKVHARHVGVRAGGRGTVMVILPACKQGLIDDDVKIDDRVLNLKVTADDSLVTCERCKQMKIRWKTYWRRA